MSNNQRDIMSTEQQDISVISKFGGVALMCVLALLGGCDKQSADAPILIKFPHVTAPATPKGRAAERFRAKHSGMVKPFAELEGSFE